MNHASKMISGAISAFLLTSVLARAGDVNFRTPPSVTAQGEQLTVTFALTAATDVEVAVLDAKGNVVRHLAAGMLGKAAPPAPLKAGLEQKLVWDGKDDFGKKAANGPFRVRVRAGSGVRFGGFIGEDAYTFGTINSIATDEDGRIYVMTFEGGLNQNMDTLRVFEPDGTYRRTLIPFPANLPAERVSAVAKWDETRKAFLPHNGRSQMPVFYPWGESARIVSASAKGDILLTHGTDLYRIDLDGGNVRGPMPMWSKAAKLENPGWNVPKLAVSPDGRYVYYANVAGTKYQPKGFDDTNPKWPQGRIYRQDTTKPGTDPESFYDLELPKWEKGAYWLPDAWNKRTAAFGIAVDGKGHVHVCDLVNQEVVEVDAQGKKIGSTKAPWPERVHIDAKSGDYYVICRLVQPKDGQFARKLLKISGRGPQANVVAELKFKDPRVGDATALGRINGQPVLWIGGGGSLLCVKDKGSTLETVPSGFKPQPGAQEDWNRIAVDYERNEIYTADAGGHLYRYDGKTGKGGLLMRDGKPFPGADVAVGYDGTLIVRTGNSWAGPLERYDHDLKPLPYATGSHMLSPYIYNRYGVGNAEWGMGVGPDGKVYVGAMYGWNKYFIAGFGADGKPLEGKYLKGKVTGKDAGGKQPAGLDSAVIGPIPSSSGGTRVDLAGNIYVGLRLWPKDAPLPASLAKDPAFTTFTGSIVKFSPAGGTVVGAVKEDDTAAEGKTVDTIQKMTVVGALAVYPGIAPFSGGGYGGGGSSCVCRSPRFDLDRYGRLIYTNAVTNAVALIDNAGNPILDFGAYGNFDSQYAPASAKDGKPLVNVPAIPLAWPTGVGFSKDNIYVNDTYNRRMVRVDWTWSVERYAQAK